MFLNSLFKGDLSYKAPNPPAYQPPSYPTTPTPNPPPSYPPTTPHQPTYQPPVYMPPVNIKPIDIHIPVPSFKPIDVPIPNPKASINPISLDLYKPVAKPIDYYSHPGPAPMPYHPPAPPSYPPSPPPTYPPTPPTYPPPPPQPPVASHQKAAVWGDPHISVADNGLKGLERRIDYDFMEKGIYSLVKDQGVDLRARFDKGPGNTTVTKEAGLTLGGDKVYVASNLHTTINGQPMQGNSATLTNGTTLTRDNKTLAVNTPDNSEYNFVFEKHYGSNDIMDVHVYSKKQGVLSDGVAPTGLLGETFDADNDIEKKPDNPNNFYARTSLF